MSAIDQLEQRLARLDARARKAADPGQMGLFGGGAGSGQPCGDGHIAADLTCHKNGGGAAPAKTRPTLADAVAGQIAAGLGARDQMIKDLKGYGIDLSAEEQEELLTGDLADMLEAQQLIAAQKARKAPAPKAQRKPAAAPRVQGALGMDQPTTNSGQDLAQRMANAATRLRSSIAELGGLGEEDARLVADFYLAKAREGGAGVAKLDPVDGQFKITHGAFLDRDALKRALPAAKAWKQKREGLTTQTAATPQQQAQLARQQQQAAAAAGDKQGELAWKKEERTVERQRIEAAIGASQQSQQSLFGVTEYDETMPLFRRDSDPTAVLLGGLLGEQLEGAQVLDWERPRSGIHAGRVSADGLVYRFRIDSSKVAFRPAWEGLSEAEWEARSMGFLQARDPNARVDFKRVSFEQRSGKRKCSVGYSCGRSCIAMAKECQITPSSAISKQRLRALQALAREGGPEFERKAAEVVAGRHAKAVQLKEERNVGQLKKLLQDPKVAEMIRTGKVPDGGEKKRSRVQDVSPNDIEVDAKRFQYKLNSSATGEVGSLSGVKKWDPNLAGVISVWEDPADGKTYVINGHNRLALARRMGAEEITVRYLDAPDAKHARAIGAMQNIAEGQGTEIDAAKFFRDTGIRDLKGVEAAGLPLRSGKAEKGLALQGLPEGLFQAVVQGQLSINRGAIIGGSGLSEEKQAEVHRMLKSNKSMTDGTLQEYVAAAFASETRKQGVLDVFGTEEEQDNLLERSTLAASLKSKLSREKRLFGLVSRSRAAQELEAKAGNQINTTESARVSAEAAQVMSVFDELKNSPGPVSDALNAAANRIKKGEKEARVRKELEAAVMQGVEDELRRLGMATEKRNPAEELGASMFDSAAARLDAIEARLARWDAGPGTGKTCGDGHIAMDLNCHKGAGSEPRPLEERLPAGVKNRWAQYLRGKMEAMGGYALAKPITVKQSYQYKGETVTNEIAVNGASYEVNFKNKTNQGGKEFVQKMGERLGIDLSDSEMWDASFETGLAGLGRGYGRHPDMPPETGRKLARAIRVEVEEMIAQMPDNTVIHCVPEEGDGLGEKRTSLYARAGFYRYSDGPQMVALVRGGKLVKPESLGFSRRDSADAIDLEWLVYELSILPKEVKPYTDSAAPARVRLDAIEARVIRLDKACVKGKACGNSCVPKSRNCRTPGQAAAAGGAENRENLAEAPPPAAANRANRASNAPQAAAPEPNRAGGGFLSAARNAGRGLVRAIANRVGVQTPGQKAEAKAQEAQAAEQRRQERLARQKAEDDEIRARGPQKWGVKKLSGAGSDGDGTIARRFEVQLEEPLQVGGRLADRLQFEVTAEPTNGKAYRKEIQALGFDFPDEALDSAVEMSWATGTGTSGFLSSNRMDLPPDVARRFALEVSKEVKGTVATMAEGQLVFASAYGDDGYGDKRRKLYERSGFTFIDGDVGIAVVRNGRITRLSAGRGDRRDAADEIDIDTLVQELLKVGPDPTEEDPERGESGGEDQATADRLVDVLERLEQRLSRLDARVKQAPGQMGLDLSGGGQGNGQACGRGHISPNYTCHKNGGAAGAGAAVAGTAASAPEQPLSEMRAEVARLKRESDAAHKVYSDAVSRYRGYSSETWDRTREQEESYTAMKAAEPIAKATDDAYHRLNNKLFEREQAIAPVTRKRAHTGLFKITGEVMTNDGAQTMLQGFKPSTGALGGLQRAARLKPIGLEHDDSDAREKSHIPDMPFWEAYDHRRRFTTGDVKLSAQAAKDLRTQLLDEDFRETAPGRFERSVATTKRQQLPYGGYNRDYVKKVELDGFEAVDELIHLRPDGATANYRRDERFSNHDRFLPDHHGPSLGELKYRGDVYTFHAFSDGQFGQAYRNKAHQTGWEMVDSEAALRARFEGYQEEGQTERYYGIGALAAMGGKIVNIKPAKVLKPWRADGIGALEARLEALEGRQRG